MQCEIARKFTLEIEESLGLQHIEISWKGEWQEKPPEDAGHQSLNDYMIQVSVVLQALKFYHLNLNQATKDMWYDDYHAFDEF